MVNLDRNGPVIVGLPSLIGQGTPFCKHKPKVQIIGSERLLYVLKGDLVFVLFTIRKVRAHEVRNFTFGWSIAFHCKSADVKFKCFRRNLILWVTSADAKFSNFGSEWAGYCGIKVVIQVYFYIKHSICR